MNKRIEIVTDIQKFVIVELRSDPTKKFAVRIDNYNEAYDGYQKQLRETSHEEIVVQGFLMGKVGEVSPTIDRYDIISAKPTVLAFDTIQGVFVKLGW
jgi:hypothetical protein